MFSLVNTEGTNQKCLIKMYLCVETIAGVLLSVKYTTLFQKYCPVYLKSL